MIKNQRIWESPERNDDYHDKLSNFLNFGIIGENDNFFYNRIKQMHYLKIKTIKPTISIRIVTLAIKPKPTFIIYAIITYL